MLNRYDFDGIEEEIKNVHLLMKKLNGENSSSLKECDVYGDKEPWRLFDKDVRETHYVFAELKKKGTTRLIDRTAGSGTWTPQNIVKEVYDREERLIGFDRSLLFEAAGEEGRDNGRWVMHEYSTLIEADYVVCAIRNVQIIP